VDKKLQLGLIKIEFSIQLIVVFVAKDLEARNVKNEVLA
jgi:hypothetical protein